MLPIKSNYSDIGPSSIGKIENPQKLVMNEVII